MREYQNQKYSSCETFCAWENVIDEISYLQAADEANSAGERPTLIQTNWYKTNRQQH